MEATPLLITRHPQKRGAAVLLTLTILGAVAMVALVTLQDEPAGVVHADADVTSEAFGTAEALSQSMVRDALQKGSIAAAPVGHSTSKNSWEQALRQASHASHAAKLLKTKVKSQEKAVRTEAKAAKAAEKNGAKANQSKDKVLAKRAAKKTSDAVQKAMQSMMHGLSSKAIDAANKAAKQQVTIQKKKQSQAQAAEHAATVKEARLQHAVDNIKRYRHQIQRIQEREEKYHSRAKAKAALYAKKVADKVTRAKLHFQQMRALLAEYRRANQHTKAEVKRIKKLKKTMGKLKRHLKKAATKLASNHLKLTKEKRSKRRAKARFENKRRRLNRRMGKLIKALKDSIKAEEKRKNTPDKNGQLQLNQLNIRSQGLAIDISNYEQRIRRLQRHIRKTHRKILGVRKKAKKRAKVLKVAHAAYSQLSHAVQRLKAVAKAQSDHIVKPRQTGMAFTKKILKQVQHKVKKTVKKAKKKDIKKLKHSLKKEEKPKALLLTDFP